MSRLELDSQGGDVTLSYPSRDNSNRTYLTVSLSDTRAADDIRIYYDFERDGWAIEQQDESLVWHESAFCPAWQFQEADDE